MDLENKNILVTGGSLGIGKETAKFLINKGANVNAKNSEDKTILTIITENSKDYNFNATQIIELLNKQN